MNKRLLLGFAAALLVAAFLSPFASSSPDGLERVAEDKGFIEKGTSYFTGSPIPDYSMPGIGHEGAATGLAGVVGTVLTFGMMYGVGKLIVRKKRGSGGYL